MPKTMNHVKLEEKSVLRLLLIFGSGRTHKNAHPSAQIWAAARNPWSWHFFACSYFTLFTHRYTWTHPGSSLVYKVVLVG